MKNPTEKFQRTVIDAVTEAANAGVHPAIVYCVLGGLQSDVLNSIKQANRMAKEDADTKTTDNIVKGNNSKPTDVSELPKFDAAN